MKLIWHPAVSGLLDWKSAQIYCASLGDSWHCPTLQELLTIVDYDRCTPASVLPDMKPAYYWSISPFGMKDVWCVNFMFGTVFYVDKIHTNYVRAVKEKK